MKKTYKGFDKEMKCRGYQFVIGNQYKHEGTVELCAKGFHACKIPMDVWSFYPINTSIYAEVEQSGDVKNDEQKTVSSVIKINATISISDMVKASVEFIKQNSKGSLNNHGHSAAQGDHGHSAAQGNEGHSAAQGWRGHSAAQGDHGHSAAQGNEGHSAAQGRYGHSAAQGERSVAVATNFGGRVKGKEGAVLILVQFEDDEITPISAVSETVGKNKIKPDTWYTLCKKGKFQEVKSGN